MTDKSEKKQIVENQQENKKQSLSTYIKLFFFYIVFSFYIGYITAKFNKIEGNMELILKETYTLNLTLIIATFVYNVYKWLETPSKNCEKGFRMMIIFGMMGFITVFSQTVESQQIQMFASALILIFFPIYFIVSLFDFASEDVLKADNFIEGLVIYPIKLVGFLFSFLEIIFDIIFLILAFTMIFYMFTKSTVNFVEIIINLFNKIMNNWKQNGLKSLFK